MQFIDNAPLYKIIRTTGPQHNFLGLQITLEPTTSKPEVEALDRNSDRRGQLGDREISEQVMLGIEQVSSELKKKYYVERIQYISTDTPPASVYRQLAIELIRRIEGARGEKEKGPGTIV